MDEWMVHYYLFNFKEFKLRPNARKMTKPILKLESLVPNTNIFPFIKPLSFPDSHLTRAYRLFHSCPHSR